VTFDRIPEAGASISTVALSVSISMSGSPLVTDWPSAFRQLSNVPFSCATPSAGMITSVAIVVACLSQEGFRQKARLSYARPQLDAANHFKRNFSFHNILTWSKSDGANRPMQTLRIDFSTVTRRDSLIVEGFSKPASRQ
jgi:hypothetical protein